LYFTCNAVQETQAWRIKNCSLDRCSDHNPKESKMDNTQAARGDFKLEAMLAISHLMKVAYEQGDYAKVEALHQAHTAVYQIAS
jgi:hypothetical protein